MRLRRLTFRGLTCFVDAQPVHLNFEQLGAGLVALVGRKGAGKTTCLEAAAAALYGRFPTRPGSLYAWAHGSDAFIEAEFANGSDQIKVRVQIDVEKNQTERYIFVNGETLTSGRAKEFDSVVLDRFGSEELFLASAFNAQDKAGSFLTAPRSKRKELFAEVLQLGTLERLSAAAKDRRSRLEIDVSGDRRVIAIQEEEVRQLPALEEALAGARARSEATTKDLATAREAEAAAIAALEQAKAEKARVDVLTQARDAAQRELRTATAALSDAEELIPRAKKAAEDAHRSLAGIDPEATEQRAKTRRAEAHKRLDTRRTAVFKTLEDEDDVLAAENRMTDLERLLAAARAHEAADRDFDNATNTAAEKIRLLRAQADVAEQAPCTTSDSWEPRLPSGRAAGLGQDLRGTCPLLKGAREAKLAILGVKVDPRVSDAYQTARGVLDGALLEARWLDDYSADTAVLIKLVEETIARVRPTANKRPLINKAKDDKPLIDKETAAVDQQFLDDMNRARRERTDLETEQARIDSTVAEAILEAEERVSKARAALHAADERFAAAVRSLAAVVDAGPEGSSLMDAERDLNQTRRERADLERDLDAAQQLLGKADAAVKRITEQQAALEGARVAIALKETDLGDWTLLETALGKNGAQALEIDAAGPEVSRIANELLLACDGPRFSIAFETLREKKSSPGEYSEAFDIKVFDSGRERLVEGLSGGERVVVGEAIGLALAIFNSRKSGVKWTTLFRDETAGALDPESGVAYVGMLRRAMELGGFDQVLFVSHSPWVWQRADARFLVEGGRVTPEAA